MSSTKIWFSRRKKQVKKSNQYKVEPINRTFRFLFEQKEVKDDKRQDKTDK